MRVFVLKARAAPTRSDKLLDGVGSTIHPEILAHTLMNAVFVAQSHRSEVVVHLVLESTEDFSRTVSFSADQLTALAGFHEAAWLNLIARALDESQGMGKEEQREVCAGVLVRTLSFERLIKELAVDCQIYMMDPKGASIRDEAFVADHLCFVLTDHIPMPKNSLARLKRLGARPISVGPKMLFASQCVVLIHNELDQR